jgi:hypothetical protein
MKELEIEFDGRGEVRGFHFTQLRKSDKAYLYKVDVPKFKPHYEVFLRKENSRYGCIAYPSSKGFGRYAWTYNDLLRAEEMFYSLSSMDNK